MINPNTQSAFRRMDIKLSGYINNPSVPGIIRTAYIQVKNLMVYMSQLNDPNQQNAGGRGPGGLMRSCNIF